MVRNLPKSDQFLPVSPISNFLMPKNERDGLAKSRLPSERSLNSTDFSEKKMKNGKKNYAEKSKKSVSYNKKIR